MSVRLDGDMVRLEGACGVEEAETLVGLLQSGRVLSVDLGQCRVLHSAVAQALLAYGIAVTGDGGTAFLRDHVAPALAAARANGLAGQLRGEAVEDASSGAAASPSERS